MPNHVTNELTAPKEVLDSLAGENGLVDFDTVFPQPQDVKDSPSALPIDYVGRNWYDWNISNWGTKWNAYGIERLSDTVIRFDTAWAHPYPVIEALSLKFPDAAIDVKYADEDLGSNLGHYSVKSGDVVISRQFGDYTDPETLEFASQLKYGVSYDELMKEWDDD